MKLAARSAVIASEAIHLRPSLPGVGETPPFVEKSRPCIAERLDGFAALAMTGGGVIFGIWR